jgi:diguanylate cyclase (GGDEF)-like protein
VVEARKTRLGRSGVIDVTEIKRAELQIHSLANYDALTGLLNRLSFLTLLENARARSERSGGPIAVALLDMDRFKEVNESLGHAAGDQLLKDVAGRLLCSVRQGDCVAREGDSFVSTVARQGGDEFLLMLSDVDEAHHAALAARRLLIPQTTLSRPESTPPPTSDHCGRRRERSSSAGEVAMYSAKERAQRVGFSTSP